MSDFIEPVRAAFEYAREQQNTGRQTPDYADHFVHIGNVPDDFRIVTFVGDEIPGDQVVVPADDADAFRDLLSAPYKLYGVEPNTDHIEQQLEHEQQHLDAAQVLGPSISLLGIRIGFKRLPGSKDELPTYGPFHTSAYQTDWLGHASVIARPEVLGRDDVRSLEMMGVTDLRTLKAQITDRNATNPDTTLLTPLSTTSEKSFGFIDIQQ